MASTYDEKQQQQQALDNTTASPSTNLAQTTTATASSANETSTNTSTQQTQQRTPFGASQFTTYTPSDSVMSAQSYLQSILDAQPGAYESRYADSVSQLYDRVMNREPFQYDLNGDMLYQQYAQRYQQQGKNAMRDTMGQAAAMTGGYGSSYASTAGNQAYQSYLAQLNDVVPELYNAAYDRYAQEGQDLTNQYNMAVAAENQDYGRYQDAMNAWQNNRAYAQGVADNERSFDYSQWNDAATREYAQMQTDRENAYNTLMAMIQKGTLPAEGDPMFVLSGFSYEDALLLAKKYGYKDPNAKKSSSKKKSSGNKNTNPDTSQPVVRYDPTYQTFRNQTSRTDVLKA